MARISFGIIALNAQPFLEYNLKGLYPFAHQIIVVEGAVRAAASLASPDGHSTDGTLEMLREFKAKHDPENKLEIVFAKDAGYKDGFWPEKNEMSQAYASRIAGDWLWQVDSDEFYTAEDMAAVIELLDTKPEITAISFPYIEFYGGFSSFITGQWHLYEHSLFHRLFRWEPGYMYLDHRPPTVVDAEGSNLREKNWIKSPMNQGSPVYLRHYSYVLPKQAQQKVGYYSNVEWTAAFRDNQQWLDEKFLQLKHPMFLSEMGWSHLQWLERFNGKHPQVIENLQNDLAAGRVNEPQREQADIDRLLASPLYTSQKLLARLFLAVFWPVRGLWKAFRKLVVGIFSKASA